MLENIVSPDFTDVVETATVGPPKEMLRVTRDGAQTEVRINSSSLSLIQTCPRKAQYSLRDGWKSKGGSPALIFGSAVHKAMEVFYSIPAKERVLPANFEELAELIPHTEKSSYKEPLFDAIEAFVRVGQPLRALPDTDKRSLASGVWMLCHYFNTYIKDTYETMHDEKGPLIERTHEHVLVDTPSKRIVLFGTIDFILRNATTGEVLPGDHKTSSQMGMDFLNRIKPNHQYTGYLLLASDLLGQSLEHFMVNGIQSKARPLTSRGGPPTFTRQITRRTQEDFREFTAAVEWAVDSYLMWEKRGFPIGSVDACAMWGGCAYLEVCSAPNELRNNMLEAKFEKTK